MSYNPEKHHRRSIRLKGHDYTQEGAYYFTICCHQRRCLLGEIKHGVIHLNLVGATVKAVWDSLPRHCLSESNQCAAELSQWRGSADFECQSGFS